MLGKYSFFLSILTPLSLFTQLHLRNFFNSTHSEEITANDIFNTRLIFSMFYLAGVILIASIFQQSLANIPFLLVALAKFFDMFSEVSYAIKQKDQEIQTVGKALILKSSALVAISILFHVMFNDFMGLLSGLLLCSFIFAIIDLSRVKKDAKIKINFNQAWLIFGMTLPLGLNAVIAALSSNTPRYILKYNYDFDSIGAYTSIFFFYASCMTMANSLIQPLLNKFSSEMKEGIGIRKRLLQRLMIITIISILIIFGNNLVGNSIYTLLFGDKNSDIAANMWHLNYIIPLGLLTTSSNYIIMAQNSYKKSLISNSISFIVHILTCFYFIDKLGTWGAFIALGLSLATTLVINIYFILLKLRAS